MFCMTPVSLLEHCHQCHCSKVLKLRLFGTSDFPKLVYDWRGKRLGAVPKAMLHVNFVEIRAKLSASLECNIDTELLLHKPDGLFRGQAVNNKKFGRIYHFKISQGGSLATSDDLCESRNRRPGNSVTAFVVQLVDDRNDQHFEDWVNVVDSNQFSDRSVLTFADCDRIVLRMAHIPCSLHACAATERLQPVCE